jgi:N-methylhydantoinase A
VGGGGDRIRAPSIDIAEVGSGGGSIAYLDRAGGLRVGPQSAGALPGPACYQRGGTEPTVTDANVVLGYIRPGKLADGEVSIDHDAASRAIYERIAKPLSMTVEQAAEGIHRIANAVTMRALRSVSTERGRDPRDFALMAFGGSGPIHAAGLARDLYVPQTIVPPLPGLFSALGLLYSGIEHHAVRSCALAGDALTAPALWQLRDEMRGKMIAQFESEGFAPAQVTLRCNVDLRFLGQASEIRLTLDERDGTSTRPYDDAQIRAMIESFQAEHLRLYGHGSDPETLVQVVAVRLVGKAGAADTMLNADSIRAQAESVNGKMRRVYFGGKWGMLETPAVTRNDVKTATQGPLLIDEYDSTTVVPPDMRVSCDAHGNLVLQTE